MLFASCCSARCRTRACARIDTRAALAMPGVKAILTADDLPDLRGAERALTNEPLYQGEPILAVAAVDELTAAEAIERIDARPRAAAVRRRSGREPAARRRQRARSKATSGIRRRRPRRRGGAAAAAPEDPDAEVDRRRISPARPRAALPMGEAPDEWSYGDLDAGFKSAAVVVDETFVVQSTGHQPMETRSAMAYWQNGKLYLHGSTQSVARTVDPLASWLGIDAVEHRAHQRVLRRRIRQQGRRRGLDGDSGAAVEEGRRAGDDAHQPRGRALHRPRAHRHGRPRAGPASRKDGRITALDLFIVEDNGPYGPMGDHRSAGNAASLIWQPLAMRWRGARRASPTRRRARSSARPARCRPTRSWSRWSPRRRRSSASIRSRSAASTRRKARRSTARRGRTASAAHITSAFVKEALDRGAELFKWDERKARAGKRAGIEGARRRRRGRPARRRLDRLRRPDDDSARRQAVRAVGRRQPRHAFVHRPRARRRRRAGDAVGQGRRQLGQHREEHAVDGDVGRQPDDARDDAREPGRRGRRAAEAAGDCREGSRRRAGRLRARRRARLPPRQPVARPDLRAGGDARDRARRQVRRPRAAGRHPSR